MPIIDYESRAEKDKRMFFDSQKISQPNKDAMTKVLRSYHTKPATRSIFIQRMGKFLSYFEDINKDMNNFDVVNDVLVKLEHTGSFETYRNKSKRFVKLLNDGELPKEYARAWSNFEKKKGGRKIEAEEHLIWPDAIELIKQTNSIQIKAALMLQLDLGMRPSNFIDLTYGDLKIRGDNIIVRLKRTKTGRPKDVEVWRCVPYLLKWMAAHPTKKANDPLWLQETQDDNELKRYKYNAILKRINSLNTISWKRIKTKRGSYKVADKVRFNKPLDFYALRHASCFLDKAEGIPIDIAAYRHDHSIEFFVEVYGKEDSKARISRIDKIRGKETDKEAEKKKALSPIVCLKNACKFVNEPGTQNCEGCGNPLTMKAALEQEQENEDKIKQVFKEQYEQLIKAKVVIK